MKKPGLKNQLFSRRIIGLFLIVSASFLIAGCEKYESSITPAGSPQSTAKINPDEEIPKQLLSIDHHSIGLGGPDYKVILFENGTVLFHGRAKVAYLGTHVSRIDAASVSYIRNMFITANFFYLPSSDPNWRMPFVATTFSYEGRTATVRDVNDGSPQLVLQIRTKAEKLMKVSELVKRSPKPEAPVSSD